MAKIIYNKTLQEYLRRFGNQKNLIRFTKQKIEEFNSKHLKATNNPNYLLEGRKWWFIQDTYYQVPGYKNKLTGAGLVLLGLLATTGVTLGVGQGVFHWFSDNGGGDTPTPKPVPPVPVEKVKITYDANGGKFESGEATITKEINKGTKWGQIKDDAPKATKTDYDYGGYTFSDGSTSVYDNFVFNSDTTLKVKYNIKQFTVTFDGKGGVWGSETSKKVKVSIHTKWSELKTKIANPKYSKHIFKYWTNNGTKLDDNFEITKDTTIDAFYNNAWAVTFNPNGGDFPTAKNSDPITIEVEEGTTFGEIAGKPKDPTKTKAFFKYWADGDTQAEIASTFEIKGDLTAKAFYKNAYTVTFDANGGVFSSNDPTKEVLVEEGTKWKDITGKPNNPTKAKDKTKLESYKFECWKNNDIAIGDEDKITKDTTVVASYEVTKLDPFEEASWYEIVNAAETKGFAGLAELYRKNEVSPTFVGCERTVKVNDNSNGAKEYKVRVVDEQADELTQAIAAANHAVLTFEFEEVLNIDDVAFNNEQTNNKDNKWNNSSIQQDLNNLTSGIGSKIVEPLDDDTHKTELLNTHFLSTKKKTNSSGTTPTDDSIFLPSLSELGLEYIPNTSVKVDDEGTVYKYYKGHTGGYKKLKNDVASNYWLRSDNADSLEKVWYVGDDGIIDKSVKYDSTLGVSPCFCIGKTSNEINVTYSLGDDSTIKFADGTTDPKSFKTKKNTTYTTFKKDLDNGVPTVTKDSTEDNDFEFKHWYYLNGDSKVEITEDYLLQDYNLVLYPEFETKPKDYKPGITLELMEGNTNPVNVSFSTKITDTNKQPSLYYSTNDGKNYTKVDWGGSTPKETKVTINSTYPKLTISSNTDNNSTYGLSQSDTLYTQIKVDEDTTTKGGRVSLSGDLRTLINAGNYQALAKTTDFCFYDLFGGDASGEGPTTLNESHNGIQDASDLKLGFSETGTKSFQKMFMAAIGMKKGPKSLEPTKIGDGAYWNMFNSCTSLKEAPALADIKDLSGTYQYYKMFLGCTALETGPKLNATKLGTWSYGSMFKYCTSLKYAPELPDGMEFVDGSERQLCGMFSGCSSLLVAPKKLSAPKLYEASYQNMFEDCSLLENGPEIYATEFATLESGKDRHMDKMFKGCTKLNYVKIYFDISTITSNTTGWMTGVTTASTSIFECPTLSATPTRSVDGIPENWNIKNF